jgi:hypothetical protein
MFLKAGKFPITAEQKKEDVYKETKFEAPFHESRSPHGDISYASIEYERCI